MKLGIVGASGLVGSALVEHLWRQDTMDVLPLIHSSGNAWHLARYGKPLRLVDLLSPSDLRAALEGCTHVINCSRGSSAVMLKGLQNLLSACRELQIARFVHISSAAVYGDVFHEHVCHEESPSRAARHTYGWLKGEGDKLVVAAARRGLPCVTLCPPSITGPHAKGFFMDVLDAMCGGEFALVGEGNTPCEIVDVDNLVHAIELSLNSTETSGQRIFITNADDLTWGQLVHGLAPFAVNDVPVEQLGHDEAIHALQANAKPRASIRRTLEHVLSSETRTLLSKDPILGSVERGAKAVVGFLPLRCHSWLRERYGDTRRPHNGPTQRRPITVQLIRQQMWGVRYSCDRATRVLGYEVVVSSAQSLERFRRWYANHYGMGSDSWALAHELSRNMRKNSVA